jgi:hypothetical protein
VGREDLLASILLELQSALLLICRGAATRPLDSGMSRFYPLHSEP